ncbi:MAG: sensor histidine kinase [Bacillota bacterium]
MIKEKKILYLLKTILLIILFYSAVYFENAQQQRLTLLVLVFAAFLANGLARLFLKQEGLYFYLSFYLDLAFIFLIEQNSRLLINYFFHSFYIIILLEAALTLKLKKGISFGVAAVLISLIKYGFLIYYKFNLANVSQMAFFLLVNVLILVIACFAQHNREERQKKDILYRELLDTHRQLKQSTDEVNRLTVVGERNRIARELHDTLGHNMTALIMQLQMTDHIFRGDAEKAEELLRNSIKTAKDSLSGIREVVETLRDFDPSEYSVSEIRSLIAEFAEKTGAVIQLTIADERGENLPDRQTDVHNSAVNMALYRIVQEALTNAVRHGKATEMSVKIDYLPNQIRFLICDNGVGAQAFQEGFGLKGIRERAEAFGGEIAFESGAGFTVRGILYLEGKND